MKDYIIYDGQDTISFFWSECNNGWMYDIYKNKELTLNRIVELEESDDGGLCTGTLKDAFEMAGINLD